MKRKAIWTGDTTSHGGTLHEGHAKYTYNNSNRAVLVGHKFWCPQCCCWSEFIEGCSKGNIFGAKRVMQGHRATCGATAIHTQGIHHTCECDCESAEARERTKDAESRQSARQNQEEGGYSHTFSIHHHSEKPINYLVFSEQSLLDMGSAVLSPYSGATLTKIKTGESEKVYIALQAPKPLLK